MATEKTPVKVTSGKDTAEFVAAKPVAVKQPDQAKPDDKQPDTSELAANEEKMRRLNEDFEARKAEIAEQERKLKQEQQEFLEKQRAFNEEQAAIAAAKQSRDNDLGSAHFSGDNVVRQGLDPSRVPNADDDRAANRRGEPIPVTEQNQRVRHISEIGDSYNGKEDTIEPRDD